MDDSNWSRLRLIVTVLLSATFGAVGCGGNQPSVDETVASKTAALTTEERISITVPSGIDFRQTALDAAETLQIGDRAQVKAALGGFAPVSNTGNVLSDFGAYSLVGNIVSVARVALHDNVHVNGAIRSAGTVSKSGGVTVSDTVLQNAALGAPDAASWRVQFPQSSQGLAVYQGQSANLAPGAYSRITLYQSAQLTLHSGTYYIDQLDLEQLSTVTLDESAGPIIVYVQTSLVYRGMVTGGTPDNLLVAYLGSLPVTIVESNFNGTLVAPSAPVRLGTGGLSHSGAIFAKDLIVDPDVVFTFVPFAGWSSVHFDVAPHFECVESRSDGSSVALFGYVNPNATPVTVVGDKNQFIPGSADRRQPTTFLTGARTSFFAVGFTGAPPRWSLDGLEATVDATKACLNSFALAAVADTTVKASVPLANFGSDALLTVGAGQATLATFDRKALLTARGSGRFVKTARLQFARVSGSVPVTARPMRMRWLESSATWTCTNDLEASPTSERCLVPDRWSLALRSGTWANPYDTRAVATGTNSDTTLSFDVTEDVQRFLSSDYGTSPMGWILQGLGETVTLASRESGNAPRLVIETIAFADTDVASLAPFGFTVDSSLSTTDQLPPFADGQPRSLGVLQTSEGKTLRFAENELLVMSDSVMELEAIKARWGATELARPTLSIPGLPLAHVLRIDVTKADASTLVPNLRSGVNRPDGLQKVSSNAALQLLAAATDEQTRGTVVGINWVIPGSAVTTGGFGNKVFVDGEPSSLAAGVENSNNDFNWAYFGPAMHEVPRAWSLLHFAGKLKPSIDVAIIDSGFSNTFQDESNFTQLVCASGSCKNPFSCGGGDSCPWHGVHVANAGFGEPNNQRAGAGPGAGVTNLTLDWGFGDMGTLLLEIPPLVLKGEEIINISAAIPVPDYFFFTTIPAEATLTLARHASGRLIFAAAGNASTNVDEKRCYDLWVTTVCPWEKTDWFPCESGGVDCVGATNYADKKGASYSNYGDSVRYWASGTVLSSADPDTDIGNQYQPESGTSFASPFIAGTAALTWAANTDQSAGDIEACLSAAQVGGPDGRFVDTFLAAACGLGNPANLPPLVEITSPSVNPALFDSGPVQLTANAADYESGAISVISWTSDVEGVIGSTASGGSLLFQPSGPGNRTITATAVDPNGAVGHATAVLSFNPAPPTVAIAAPASDNESVVLGLPTDLFALVTNLKGFGAVQPCDTAVWTGYEGNSIVFDHLGGCATQATFLNPGRHHVDVSMTVNGQVGRASRSFNVVSDDKLHVKITNPLRSGPTNDWELDKPQTLTAVSTAMTTDLATYVWTISEFNSDGVLAAPQATLYSQSAVYTPTAAFCNDEITVRRVTVTAVDTLLRAASDTVDVHIFHPCPPH